MRMLSNKQNKKTQKNNVTNNNEVDQTQTSGNSVQSNKSSNININIR